MLAFIASTIPAPAEEHADRDSGVLTLAFALARGLRRQNREATTRRCDRAREAEASNGH